MKKQRNKNKNKIFLVGLGTLSLMAILWGIGSINQVGNAAYNYTTTTNDNSTYSPSISTIQDNIQKQINSFGVNFWNGYSENGYLWAVTQNPNQTQILSVTALESTNVTTYALSPDGSVYAWGYNGSGQVGNGTTSNVTTPVNVLSSSDSNGEGTGTNVLLPNPNEMVDALYSDGNTTYALTSNGSVYAWGDNDDGQVGNGTTSNVTTPTAILGPDAGQSGVNIADLFVMPMIGTVFALTSTGGVYGWGYNKEGQVGNGTTSNVATPTLVLGTGSPNYPNADINMIYNQGDLTYATDTSGNLYVWGYNNDGQVGNGTTSNVTTPTLIMGPDSTNYAGDGTVNDVYTVYPHIPNGNNYVSFTINSNGVLYGWGGNSSGQVGNGTTSNVTTPTAILGPTGSGANVISGSNITYFNAGGNGTNSYAIDSNGDLYAWGANGNGRTANGTASGNTTSPNFAFAGNGGTGATIDLPAGVKMNEVITSGTMTWGITNNGSLYSWGYNGSYAAGNGGTGGNSGNNIWIPYLTIAGDGQGGGGINLPAGEEVTNFYLGGNEVSQYRTGNNYTTAVYFALTSNGSVYAWGNNTVASVGNGTTSNVATPTAVIGPDYTGSNTELSNADVISLALGSKTGNSKGQYTSVSALTQNGSVYGWGNNGQGEVGNGTTSNVATPTAVIGPDYTGSNTELSNADVTNVVKSSDGGKTTYYSSTDQSKQNNSIYANGYNNEGQVGNGTTSTVTTPTLVLDYSLIIGSVSSTINSSNNTVDIDYTYIAPTPEYLVGNVTTTLYNGATQQPVSGVSPSVTTPVVGTTTYSGEFKNVPLPSPKSTYYLTFQYTIGNELFTLRSHYIFAASTMTPSITSSVSNTNRMNYSITDIPSYNGATYTATLWNVTTNSAVNGVNSQTVNPKNFTASGAFVIPPNTNAKLQVQLAYTYKGKTTYFYSTPTTVNTTSQSMLWLNLTVGVVVLVVISALSVSYYIIRNKIR